MKEFRDGVTKVLWKVVFVLPGTPNNQFFMVVEELDDSKSIYGKWLFNQTSIKNCSFRVPGSYYVRCEADWIRFYFRWNELSYIHIHHQKIRCSSPQM